MKKIYSKITKERRKQFQIETYIMKDGEQRLVVKRALAKDGVGRCLIIMKKIRMKVSCVHPN